MVVEEVIGCGKCVMIVGGSGFYLKVFFVLVVDDVMVLEVLCVEIVMKLE